MRTYIIIILLLVSHTCFAQIRGKVVSVADGDTFTMLIDGNKQVKIRLHGIDCPEKKQAFGSVAKQFTSSKVFGKVVTVKATDTDRYGRTIGIVYIAGNQVLNELLLSNGLAWHYKKYDRNPVYAQLEISAKNSRRGLWSDKNAIAPWEFRHIKK